MAGASVTIKVDDGRVQDLLKKLAWRMTDLTPAMAEIGEIVIESVQRNFEEHRSPDGRPWPDLAPATRKRKRHPGKKLYEAGTLFKSIHRQAHPDRVEIGTNIIYAAVHQFGRGVTSSRSGGTVFDIPPRPFLGVRDNDWPEIRAAIEERLREFWV